MHIQKRNLKRKLDLFFNFLKINLYIKKNYPMLLTNLTKKNSNKYSIFHITYFFGLETNRINISPTII